MSIIGIILYLVVIVIAISGVISRFGRSKKTSLIMLSVSPVYLFIAHFISPYINWRGKFDAVYSFARAIGFSQQESVYVRYIILFVIFWVIFFSLSAFTFEFLLKRKPQNEPPEENPFE